MTPLLVADELTKTFTVRGATAHALNGISIALGAGETLAVVGESGSGKSTLARVLTRLLPPDSGQIAFDGADALALRGADLRAYHRRVQMVFQDPAGSLNPRMTVGAALAEPLAVHRLVPRAGRDARVAELLDLVGLPHAAAGRRPAGFSGGQRQRIAIARALALQPDLLVADEVVSALDVSIQAQILNLLVSLQQRLALGILFISHDLRVVRHLAHRVAVMYLGGIVEEGPAEAVFASPRHPYTRALLAAAPRIAPGRARPEPVRGEMPSPLAIPPGCPFHPRCPIVRPECRTEAPREKRRPDGHAARCHADPG